MTHPGSEQPAEDWTPWWRKTESWDGLPELEHPFTAQLDYGPWTDEQCEERNRLADELREREAALYPNGIPIDPDAIPERLESINLHGGKWSLGELPITRTIHGCSRDSDGNLVELAYAPLGGPVEFRCTYPDLVPPFVLEADGSVALRLAFDGGAIVRFARHRETARQRRNHLS